jgi:hypothetical protein
MSEPYKLIEREIPWDDFYVLLQGDNELIKIKSDFTDRWYSVYDWNRKDIFFRDGKIQFFSEYTFLKEFNETIKYGFGKFYPVSQIFDEEETGEMQEYEGNDGMVYKEPITKQLDTFKLVERELSIFQLKKF